MKIRVRDAKPRDLGLFRKLLSDSFSDKENEGLLVIGDEKTIAFFDELFKSAIAVFFVADKGMLMLSENLSPASFKVGKLASVMASYVTPDARDQGIEEALLGAAVDRSKELDFGGITFSTPSVGKWQSVSEDLEFEPFMLHAVKPL
jgi:ribosomal protein S18 acetylase RimI-like enzyme